MLKVPREKPYLASEEAQETLFFNELCQSIGEATLNDATTLRDKER